MIFGPARKRNRNLRAACPWGDMKKTLIKGLAIVLIVCQLAACQALAAGSVSYGEKNEEIVTMQKRLKELGYFAGECTGFFGEFTKTAIENFQKANGLVVNGEADAETLAAMEKENAVTKNSISKIPRRASRSRSRFRRVIPVKMCANCRNT